MPHNPHTYLSPTGAELFFAAVCDDDCDDGKAPDTEPCVCEGTCMVAWLRPGLRCARGDSASEMPRRLLGHGDDMDFDVLALIPTVAAPDTADCEGSTDDGDPRALRLFTCPMSPPVRWDDTEGIRPSGCGAVGLSPDACLCVAGVP